MFPFSMFNKTSSAKPDNAVAVERLERKPKLHIWKYIIWIKVFVQLIVDYPF